MTSGDHPFHLHGFLFQVLKTIYKDKGGNLMEVVPAPSLENIGMKPATLARHHRSIGSSLAERLAGDNIDANGGVALSKMPTFQLSSYRGITFTALT